MTDLLLCGDGIEGTANGADSRRGCVCLIRRGKRETIRTLFIAVFLMWYLGFICTYTNSFNAVFLKLKPPVQPDSETNIVCHARSFI
jgi:hypothetical protein